MAGIVSIDEWEHSKENILPVKSGRKASALARAFSSDTDSLDAERSEFENRMQQLSGCTEEESDPLSIWLEYFTWAKESFPTSRTEQLRVIQSATKLYRNSEYYQQDERYLRLWIRYADMLSNPLEMFQYLYNKDIGTDWALFYEARAIIQENLGKYKDAEESYKIGIARKVEPLASLKEKYSHFSQRMEERVKILIAKRSEVPQERSRHSSSSSRSQRTSERRRPAGLSSSQRSSNATLSYSTMPVVPLQDQNRLISVLRDESNTKPIPNEVKVEWNEFATEEESTKENVLGATAWSGKTLPQKRAQKPSKKATFAIYIDPECQEQHLPPNDNVNEITDEPDDEDLMMMIKQIKSRVAGKGV